MSVQVTLTIDSDLYRQAEKLAQLRQRDVAELLAESIQLPQTSLERERNENMAVAREEAAFNRLHPQLWAVYPNQYVAIHNEAVVDHDADQVALYMRVKKQYPNEFVWIAPVKDTAVETYTIHSPRFSQPR